ncbi:hypothetical protein [Streptosporangium sp. NPDC000396]|uniref:ARPP-2 domain-containing protein n=1 Tax=Streptosporangium sp. NPDC000396 TaxID=3366185 RepID=UPI0036CCDF51
MTAATLDLTGLATRPAQVWGGVRLVPLVRDEPITSLRLHPHLYGDEPGIVRTDRRASYLAYIPHAFVANWTADGSPAAAYGTQLLTGDGGNGDSPLPRPSCVPLRFHHRMARRTGKNRLRFLPLHMAMEGYLALHFGGPDIVWEEWSHRAVSHGLSPRAEQAYVGTTVTGLQDALRVFEIHPGQCGVLIYVADALASAFVVPHPDDYRALHPTLVQNLYGELIYHYAMLSAPVQDFRARIDGGSVRTLADLRIQVRRQRDEWAAFHDDVMAGGLLDTDYTFGQVYRMGPFTLSRFLPPFHRQRENHIGETITDADGRLAYLKTFRLSENQVRRGHLLTCLAAGDWHLETTAAALDLTAAQLALRIESAGFGALLRQDVLDRYRAQARRS